MKLELWIEKNLLTATKHAASSIKDVEAALKKGEDGEAEFLDALQRAGEYQGQCIAYAKVLLEIREDKAKT